MDFLVSNGLYLIIQKPLLIDICARQTRHTGKLQIPILSGRLQTEAKTEQQATTNKILISFLSQVTLWQLLRG